MFFFNFVDLSGALSSLLARLSLLLQSRKLDECVNLFQQADADCSGDIDYKEIEAMFKVTGKQLSTQRLKDLITLVDDDNTGTLRFSE